MMKNVIRECKYGQVRNLLVHCYRNHNNNNQIKIFITQAHLTYGFGGHPSSTVFGTLNMQHTQMA